MKKIVHITNDLQRLGGVQRLLVDLMALQKDDFEFEVILTRGENEYIGELKSLGVSVYHKRDLGLFGVIKRMNNADLVHAHLFPSMYIALLSSTLKIVTEHNPYYRRRDIKLVKWFESLFFRRFKKVVCISGGVKTAFETILNWRPGKALVINNGVDLSRFSMRKRSKSNLEIPVKLGMVGRLVKQKDIPTLIRTVEALGRDYELHLAGDGEQRHELETLVSDLGLNEKVFFHGQVNDIPLFLEGIDIYVQSSNWEGFGLAVVEAMAAGLPCFATNVEGLNDVIKNDGLFEVGDVTRLTELVLNVSKNIANYNETSAFAINTAYDFSIENTAKQHNELYNMLLGNKQ